MIYSVLAMCIVHEWVLQALLYTVLTSSSTWLAEEYRKKPRPLSWIWSINVYYNNLHTKRDNVQTQNDWVERLWLVQLQSWLSYSREQYHTELLTMVSVYNRIYFRVRLIFLKGVAVKGTQHLNGDVVVIWNRLQYKWSSRVWIKVYT